MQHLYSMYQTSRARPLGRIKGHARSNNKQQLLSVHHTTRPERRIHIGFIDDTVKTLHNETDLVNVSCFYRQRIFWGFDRVTHESEVSEFHLSIHLFGMRNCAASIAQFDCDWILPLVLSLARGSEEDVAEDDVSVCDLVPRLPSGRSIA
jgi:hypothetical protein